MSYGKQPTHRESINEENMKYLCTFLLFMAFFSGAIGQKPLRALKQVYSKKELNEFKQIHGSLDLLYFAYDKFNPTPNTLPPRLMANCWL
ncbi:MAG: hypothetical protein EB023_00345 [Flavobacteriia bacterium]|nr:hypothetical protein [Flavobacteriia bacterium]